MNMDKPVRRVAIFALLLFFGLMAQVNYVQGSQAEDLRTDGNNARQFEDPYESPRGQISAGGEVLVASKETAKDSEKYDRTYKDGPVFAPVTGVFSASGTPSQVERAYNSLLGGKDKRITQQRWFDTFIGKKPEGANIELTIDTDAQRTAYEQLKAKTSKGRRGGAVVIDVKTGAVKVAASWPSFDPNEVAPQTQQKGMKRLAQLEEGNGVLRPLIDNALSQTFPPGSSFKIIMAALGMDILNMDGSTTVDTSALILPESGTELVDSHDGGNCATTAPLSGAFIESCNSSFGRMALELGIQQMHDATEKFGFGKRTELEPDMYAATSVVPTTFTGADGKTIKTGKDGTARSGIGQENVQTTVLQMAMAAAAVGNDGVLMKPHVVSKARTKEGDVVYSADPKELGKAIPKDDAGDIAEWMRKVVQEGTATNLRGRNIAGKTGTAEQGENPNARWFVGFGPVEGDPRYAFAVMSEGPGAGADGAGPIAAAIMSKVLKK